MAQTRKRNSLTVPNSSAVDAGLGDTSVLKGAIPTLAAEFGFLLGEIKAQHSPALNLQQQLEVDFYAHGNRSHVKRLPPILGLAIALVFSVASWLAISKLVSFLFQ